MNRIAKFEKVSIGQFTAAWKDTFQEQSEEKICEIYGALKLQQPEVPDMIFLHR